MCYTIITEREGKPKQTRKETKAMKNTRIEYGTGDITVVYLVDDDKQKDLIAMPVLFTENRFAMAWVIYERENGKL